MSKELAERIGEDGDIDLLATGFTYKTLQAISQTEFVPKGLRGKVPAILACVMAGRELGLGPMESLNKIDVIDGRPSPSAELMVAMVYRAGHEVYPGAVSEESATAIGIRCLANGDVRRHTFTFTMEDARRAGLATKNNWKNYPGPMLYWRAVSQLVRMVFPDVMSAFKAYTPDELEQDDWEPPDPTLTVAEDGPEPVEATIIDRPEPVETSVTELDLEMDKGSGNGTVTQYEEDDPARPFEATFEGHTPEELTHLLSVGIPKGKGDACDAYERVCDLLVECTGADTDVAHKSLESWRQHQYRIGRDNPGQGSHGSLMIVSRLSGWKSGAVQDFLRWFWPLAEKRATEVVNA